MVVVVSPLCHTRSPPPLLAQNSVYPDVSHNLHPPASAACRCAPRRVPASTAISWIRLPPLFRPWPSPRSLSAPVGLPNSVPSVSPVSFLPPCVLHHFPEYSGSWSFWVSIFVQGRGSGALPLPSICSSRPPPPPRYMGTPEISFYPSPPPLPPYPPPPL